MPRAWTVLTLILAACQSNTEPQPEPITECPPAPLDPGKLFGRPCALPDAGIPSWGNRCIYQEPVFVVSPYSVDSGSAWFWKFDPCNGRILACADGKVDFVSGLLGCRDRTPPPCPSDLVEGKTCVLADDPGGNPMNGECFLPANGVAPTGAAGEKVPGKACACDRPGPIWRCIPGTFTAPP